MATCVDEPTAISTVMSSLFLSAKKIADACSAALPMTGIRIRPTKTVGILSVLIAEWSEFTRRSDSSPTARAATVSTMSATLLDQVAISPLSGA